MTPTVEPQLPFPAAASPHAPQSSAAGASAASAASIRARNGSAAPAKTFDPATVATPPPNYPKSTPPPHYASPQGSPAPKYDAATPPASAGGEPAATQSQTSSQPGRRAEDSPLLAFARMLGFAKPAASAKSSTTPTAEPSAKPPDDAAPVATTAPNVDAIPSPAIAPGGAGGGGRGGDQIDKRSRAMRRLKIAAYACLAVVAAGAGWIGIMLIHYTTEFPNPLAVRAKERTPVIRIMARDGSLIADRGTVHAFMPIDMLPEHVINAVVATEDRRFFSHWGIDPAGMTRAAFANLRAGRFVQGGSTLTQQLAKNLFLSSDRTMSRKFDELALALWLEVRLSKREILELYLNRVYFGAGAYGIEAAAQRYFDKSARALTLAEAALVAGLLKAPSRYAPTASVQLARQRGVSVLEKMHDAGFISQADLAKAKRQKVQFAELKQNRVITGYEHLIDLVLEKLPPVLGDGQDELIVETTIDPSLQKLANEVVASSIDKRGKAMGASQAALVAIDRNGGIRALVGGRSYEESQFNRVTRAKRQPGSVFKPVVYLTALEKGLTPETITYDLPLSIDGWSPKNDNGDHVGALTLRQALAQSINTVAVRLNMDVGIASVADTARRLGIRSELRHDPSIALGTSEVTLLELTGAYGVLASGGLAIEPHVIRRVRVNSGRVLYARAHTDHGRVVSEEIAGSMNDMLNAALVAGTGRRAALPRHPAAGKTGTTQDYRDAWFIGYTAHMTLGIWMGNDDGSPMRKVMGGNLPAEMWRELMLEVHKGLEPRALPGTSPLQRNRSDDPPIASTQEREVLPWHRGRERDREQTTASPVMRAAAETASASDPPGSATPQPSTVASGGASGALLPRSRSLAAVKSGAATAPPPRPSSVAQRPAAPPSHVVGQRIVVEPPPASRSMVRSPLPSVTTTASKTPQRHPKDRISDDFLARVLAEPVETRLAAPRGAPVAPRGFDAADIQRRLDNLPSSRDEPRGMMSLGVNGVAELHATLSERRHTRPPRPPLTTSLPHVARRASRAFWKDCSASSPPVAGRASPRFRRDCSASSQPSSRSTRSSGSSKQKSASPNR
ncbi:MAG: PBP1A family penicillin-binding protein, partial [Hyphomicrobiaceae bacterium]